jgi:hypothetical protein
VARPSEQRGRVSLPPEMDAPSEAPARSIVSRRRFAPTKGTLDLAEIACVEVTSEQSVFPIDNVFDGQSGPGGSCWVAATPGEQIVALAFRSPQDVTAIVVESEERGVSRTQRVELAFWGEDGNEHVEGLVHTFRFAPYGPSFHRGAWAIGASVTRIQLRITPEPHDGPVTLTSIVVR